TAGSAAHGGSTAVRFSGGDGGIHFPDAAAKGRLNYDADEYLLIRIVFRTAEHHSNGGAGAGALLAKDVGASTPSWWLRVEDGRLRFLMDDGEANVSLQSNTWVSDGAWHEVV